MNKPNYRLGKVETIVQADILAGVNLRKSLETGEDKTFSKLFDIIYDCDCYSDIPTCRSHSSRCENYVSCRNDIPECGPYDCSCVDHYCSCHDHYNNDRSG